MGAALAITARGSGDFAAGAGAAPEEIVSIAGTDAATTGAAVVGLSATRLVAAGSATTGPTADGLDSTGKTVAAAGVTPETSATAMACRRGAEDSASRRSAALLVLSYPAA